MDAQPPPPPTAPSARADPPPPPDPWFDCTLSFEPHLGTGPRVVQTAHGVTAHWCRRACSAAGAPATDVAIYGPPAVRDGVLKVRLAVHPAVAREMQRFRSGHGHSKLVLDDKGDWLATDTWAGMQRDVTVRLIGRLPHMAPSAVMAALDAAGLTAPSPTGAQLLSVTHETDMQGMARADTLQAVIRVPPAPRRSRSQPGSSKAAGGSKQAAGTAGTAAHRKNKPRPTTAWGEEISGASSLPSHLEGTLPWGEAFRLRVDPRWSTPAVVREAEESEAARRAGYFSPSRTFTPPFPTTEVRQAQAAAAAAEAAGEQPQPAAAPDTSGSEVNSPAAPQQPPEQPELPQEPMPGRQPEQPPPQQQPEQQQQQQQPPAGEEAGWELPRHHARKAARKASRHQRKQPAPPAPAEPQVGDAAMAPAQLSGSKRGTPSDRDGSESAGSASTGTDSSSDSDSDAGGSAGGGGPQLPTHNYYGPLPLPEEAVADQPGGPPAPPADGSGGSGAAPQPDA